MPAKAFRVPLFGPYTNRVSTVNALDSSSGYVGVGIVGLMVVGKTSSTTDKDSRFLNCFAQTVNDSLTGQKRIYTVKRPGFATSITPASGGTGTAILVWTGQGAGTKVITAFGATNSTIYDSITSLGAITGVATGITETFVSTTATLAISSNDNTGWYYDTGVGVATKIASVNFPGNAGKTLAGTFAHMDGYACIMDTAGGLWASDLNSVVNWTATSTDSANAYPDKGVGCVRYKNFIMAFGTESVQFFYNAGLSPFPFAKSNAMTVKVGAVSADAITEVGDTKFWAGSTPQGGISVFQFDGTVGRVSSPEIDTILVLAGASNITLTSIRFYGRSFVIVRASTTTLVYCIEEKSWHEWNSTTPLWYKCAGVSLGGTLVNYAVTNQSTNGKVYVMNNALLTFTDDSTTYTARMQLAPMDLGTNNKKAWKEVSVVGDQEASTSTITLAYSDDDYATYTTVGTGDLSGSRVNFTRLGSSRKRAWVLTHSANTPMRLEYMQGRAEIGTS